MIKKKYFIWLTFVVLACISAQSCGIFKKDCGCPDPYKATKRK